MVFKFCGNRCVMLDDRHIVLGVIDLNTVGIFNQTGSVIEDELKTMNEVLQFALKKENLDCVEFNVILVDNEMIHTLNKTYRGIDRTTDVITFALEDDKTVITSGKMRVLGDIYISLDKAKEQAIEYGHSFMRELCFLSVHGFYHLLGYDHQNEEEEKIMFSKQEEVLSGYGIKR